MFVLTEYRYVVSDATYSMTFDEMLDIQMTNPYLTDDDRETVSHYLDPRNFPAGSAGYYQFLDLRATEATLTAAQIDAYINSRAEGR